MDNEWHIYQTRHMGGLWITKIMHGPFHVQTFESYTARGGRKRANKLMKERNANP